MVDINKKKLLIVDDDLILQSALHDYLSQKNFEVNGILTGEEIDHFLQKQTVNLILLDIMLPGEDGYYWLEWLQDYHPNIPVLMLSSKNQIDDKVKALEMGANDYIAKPADPREILARINNILKLRSQANTANKVTFGSFVFEIDRCKLFCNNKHIRLTTTESQLLKIFCENPNKTLSRDDLSFKLHGNQHNPYDRSIDVHINRLRNKIEKDPSDPIYLLTTWGKGYRFVFTESLNDSHQDTDT